MLITADQIRAARALKNWSQTDLAERTGLAVPTIANIELGKQTPGKNTMEKIIDAFSAAGIEFLGERGVQKKSETTTVYRGESGLTNFYIDIYETLNKEGGEVLVGNVDERKFVTERREEDVLIHQQRMAELKDNVKYKILIEEGDDFFAASSYAEYRWTPKEDFQSIPFYVYGNKLAIILWLDEPIVFLIDSANAADVYREKFSQMWKKSKVPPNFDKAKKKFQYKNTEELLETIATFQREQRPKKKGRK